MGYEVLKLLKKKERALCDEERVKNAKVISELERSTLMADVS